jgi:hypothetical protein
MANLKYSCIFDKPSLRDAASNARQFTVTAKSVGRRCGFGANWILLANARGTFDRVALIDALAATIGSRAIQADQTGPSSP